MRPTPANKLSAAERQAVRDTAHRPEFASAPPGRIVPARVHGLFYYLYLVLDLYSRKIVAAEVYPFENGINASALIRRAALAEGCVNTPPVLHADNGGPMKGQALHATLEWLGIERSFSRPRVSNDNAYAEAMFRTVKYRPTYPERGFQSLEAARDWMADFGHWYNQQHRHSALKYVTPAQPPLWRGLRHPGRPRSAVSRHAPKSP